MRVAVAIVLAIFVGFWAFAGLVSDLGPGESSAGRVAYLSGLFIVGGLLVGFLAGRWWWLAALCAWAPLVQLVLGVYHGLRRAPGGVLDLETAGHVVFALGLALLSAWLGRRLRHKLTPRPPGQAGA